MFHQYADDTQVYVSCKPADASSTIRMSLESCISDINQWLAANNLVLNPGKTEVIVFAPKSKESAMENFSLAIGGQMIQGSASVRNLGVIFDTKLAMDSHVLSVRQSCYHHLKCISRIRRYLTLDATKSLVNSLVTSRLDYANSLLSGLSEGLIGKLQKVQNYAARVVSRSDRRSHITTVLATLHWLPVKFRLQYKLLLLVYKSQHDELPDYLSTMFKEYVPARNLRSSNSSLLCVPKTKTVKYGDKSFVNSSTVLWNALPETIKFSPTTVTFKRALKTHLFQKAFVT